MNREDFPMTKENLIYFDNAATTLKPKIMLDYLKSYYYEYCSNAHRGDYKTSAIVDNLYESTREEIKNFINAKKTKEIVFTSLEYKILYMLISNKNILVTREQILDKIWDVAGNFVNDNTLTVYIKRIRNKLDDKEGKFIQTVRGIGYKVVE